MGGQPQNFRDEAGAFHESTFPNWSLGTRMKNALCDRAEYNPESAFSPAFSGKPVNAYQKVWPQLGH